MSNYQHVEGVRDTPRHFNAFDGKLELRCPSCGTCGKYAVGRIFIDPKYARRPAASSSVAEAVTFSGLFLCRQCGAAGPWQFPLKTQGLLLALLAEAIQNPAEAQVHLGQMAMFDGTLVRTAAEAEKHFRKLIEADPSNYYLWSRLGNLYSVAEEEKRAAEAFRKAIELNPHDVESHHSLACYHYERNQRDRAADHFHEVLRHSRTAPRETLNKPQLLRSLVRNSLECLLDLNMQSKGRIDFLPPPDPLPPGEKLTEVDLEVRDFNLSTERGWEALTKMFLPSRSFPGASLWNRLKKLVRPETRVSLPAPAPVKIGRNLPCPCGSGKKFKKCCGAHSS